MKKKEWEKLQQLTVEELVAKFTVTFVFYNGAKISRRYDIRCMLISEENHTATE